MISFRHYDPLPLRQIGVLDGRNVDRNVIALTTLFKYWFANGDGSTAHEYEIPNSVAVINCGGYIDKLIKYRDPKIRVYFDKNGFDLSKAGEAQLPLLLTRSPKLDVLAAQLIQKYRTDGAPVAVYDHGCSVAEHYDLLDVVLRANAGRHAHELIAYTGLDISPLLLAAARMLHANVPAELFRLIRTEGSQIPLEDASQDVALSVGVINHVADPKSALRELLRVTKRSAVFAAWVTSEPDGFWAINHSGVASYFYSRADLDAAGRSFPQGKFHIVEFIPESESSQPNSYVGIGAERIETLGCYHLVWTIDRDLPFASNPLV